MSNRLSFVSVLFVHSVGHPVTGRWIMSRKQLLRNLIAAVVALSLTAGYMAILEEATLYYGEPANATVAPGSARTVG